jgi:hypothetical protein
VETGHSMTSSARAMIDGEIVRPMMQRTRSHSVQLCGRWSRWSALSPAMHIGT